MTRKGGMTRESFNEAGGGMTNGTKKTQTRQGKTNMSKQKATR